MRTRQAAGVVFASLQLPEGMHHRFVTLGEAERMRERGECRRLSLPGKKCIGKARPTYRLIPRTDPSDSQCTPAAITASDILVSVGLKGTHEARVAAREKIRHYRQTH